MALTQGIQRSELREMQSLSDRRLLIGTVWGLVLLISDLPDVLLHSLTGQVPEWLFYGKVGVLASSVIACLVWKRIRPLWQFAFVFTVFYLALAGSSWLGNTSFWSSRFSGDNISFTTGYLGIFIRDFGVALAVIAALWIVKRDRKAFFLTTGQLDAPIAPVRWLGIGKGESWRVFGWIFTGCAAVAIVIPLLLSVPISGDALMRAVPLIPAALLFAAINAFNEEIYYRASLFSTLQDVIGKNQALLLNVVYFGLAHYLYGSPPGLPGFLLTGLLAFLLGKSILETKGLGWAWFMHFVPDVMIFISYAIAWVY